MRDPGAPHDPITERWTVGAPFQLHGDKVKDDALPSLLVVMTQPSGARKFFGLNIAGADLKGFNEVTGPRTTEGPWFANEPGDSTFQVVDVPKANTGKDAKVTQTFSINFS